MAFTKKLRLAVLAIFASVSSGEERTDLPFVFDESTLPVLTRTVALFNTVSGDLAEAPGLKWSYVYTYAGETAFVQLRVVAANLPSAKWWILVFDENGQQQDRMESSEFVATGGSSNLSQWTRVVPGRKARLELRADAPLDKLQLRIERCNYQFSEPGPKVMVSGVPLVDLSIFPRTSNFYQWSRPIAYIYFQKPGTGAGSNCTGFLVTPTLLMTNHHCIYLDSQLRTAYVAFNYETGESTPDSLHVRQLVATDAGLDYSILRIDPPSSAILPVRLSASPVRKGENLVLIQHPNYLPKQISRNCGVEADSTVGAQDGLYSDFFHICSSEGGASGSPLMDGETGQVVGLHHAGKWKDDAHAYHNLGVKIPLILKDLDQPRYSKIRDEIRQSQRM